MTLALDTPLLAPSEQFSGEIEITIPIKCTGPSVDATVALYIYEGSWLPTHGTLLAEYYQDVHFEQNIAKDVTFRHQIVPPTSRDPSDWLTGPSKTRDIGCAVEVGGEVVAGHEWDDVYAVSGGGGFIDVMMPMMGLMMMLGMVGMVMGGAGEGMEGGVA